MSRLNQLVENVVEGFRTTFYIMSVIAIGLTIFERNWIGLVFLGPILIACYFGGLWLVANVLAMVLPKHLLYEDLQIERIRILNEKIESGELTVDDPQLAIDMKQAGLRPLSVITEKGPIFGRQFDANLYEWIDAKEGDHEVGRYVHVGKAEFEEDGTVFINNQNSKSLYLVLDGILYERTME